jgi:peptidoglycan/LPS O-acetylase OafA/YrhL
VYAGGLSFATYLLHEPVMLAIRMLTGAPTHISLGSLATVSLVVVVALAVLFTRGLAWLETVRTRRPVAKGETP